MESKRKKEKEKNHGEKKKKVAFMSFSYSDILTFGNLSPAKEIKKVNVHDTKE
jgi:hypothetical protein